MKRLAAFGLVLALLCAGSCLAGAIAFPPLTGRVVDQAGLLGQDASAQLTQELAQQESTTGQQVVVAIVSSLQGQTIEDYGYQLGRTWGIGQKDKDTGAILLVAPKEHKVRIEVGYGLEGTLTDAKSADIINEIILPQFKQGQMQQGVVAGAGAMLNVLNGRDIDAALPTAVVQDHVRRQSTGSGITIGHVIFWVIFIAFILWLQTRRSSLGWLPLIGMQSWGTGGGGFSNGFSGGGGSFGGGGASGSW